MPTIEWIGKDKVINHHLNVPYRLLEYRYTYTEKGLTDDETSSDSKIIRGDNLEALKALLPQYEGRVKCIYIDPPYNTGNEGWVYNDNVSDPKIKKWLGQVVGREGEDLSRHDKWLCMMYPRLKLLQRLLADDGFIFISIDAFEFSHLKLLLDEIFGPNNFRNCVAVRRGIKNVQAQFNEVQALSLGHEYIYLYSKRPDRKLPKLSVKLANEKPGKWDTFWRGTDRPTMRYELFGINPTSGQWRWEPGRAGQAIENYKYYKTNVEQEMSLDDYYIDCLMSTNVKLDFVRFNEACVVQYYVPPQSGKLLSDNWMDILLSGSYTGFNTEKNVLLIERIIRWITKGDDIILDSFAGSGTTGHAVLNLNKEDHGKRKFILVEMESYAESITAKRVKRVIDGDADVVGTGGNFSFYDLGHPLLLDNQYLNEEVPVQKIREYLFFTETKQPMEAQKAAEEPYLLGIHNHAAYYFYYEKPNVTVLNHDFLSRMKTRAECYVIYADKNTLSDSELEKYYITFKKIPRDITRL